MEGQTMTQRKVDPIDLPKDPAERINLIAYEANRFRTDEQHLHDESIWIDTSTPNRKQLSLAGCACMAWYGDENPYPNTSEHRYMHNAWNVVRYTTHRAIEQAESGDWTRFFELLAKKNCIEPEQVDDLVAKAHSVARGDSADPCEVIEYFARVDNAVDASSQGTLCFKISTSTK